MLVTLFTVSPIGCLSFIFLPDTDICSRTFHGTHVNDTLTLQHLWQFSHLQNIILVFFSEKQGTPEKRLSSIPILISSMFCLLSGEGISSCRQAGCGLSESKSCTQGALRTPSVLPGQVAEGWFERRHGRYLSLITLQRGCGVFKQCRCFGLLFCSWWVKSLPFLFGTSWKIQVDSGQETMRFLFPGIMPRLDHGIFRDSTRNTGMYPFCEMYLWWKLATQQAIDNSDSGNSEGDELLYDIACFTHPMISPCGFESKNNLQNMVQISSIVRSPVPFRSVELPNHGRLGSTDSSPRWRPMLM